MKRQKQWTENEEKFTKKNYQKYSYAELGKKIGRTERSIGHKINRMGLEKGHLNYELKIKNKRLTKELAYILGATYGDGSVKCRDRLYTRILFYVKDKEFAIKYKKYFDKQFGIKSSFHRINTKYGIMYRVRIGYKEICEFIKNFNMNIILESNNEVKKSFLIGLYDAEGHVGMRKNGGVSQIGFTNTNDILINAVSTILSDFDIRYSIINKTMTKRCKPCKIVIITNRDSFLKFRKHIGFSIKRKQERLNFMPKLRDDKEWHDRLTAAAIRRPRDTYGKFLSWKEVLPDNLMQGEVE